MRGSLTGARDLLTGALGPLKGVRLSLGLGRHLIRLAPTTPMALAAGPALALAAVPSALSLHLQPVVAALLLRVVTTLCVLPVAFALDDPGARTTAVLPFPVTPRRLLRLVPVCVPLAAAWTVCALLLRAAVPSDDRAALPLAGLCLEAAALGSAAVLLAALGLRLTGGERGSALAAPGSVLLPLALLLGPARPWLFAVPHGEFWEASRRGWASALIALTVLAAVFLGERRASARC
ncbi:hypothetical protein ABZX85_41100 [Streptomyces sp. NPDC004539]|uniref:hypothetical protein n=1 Tax=Streptomyces sp. NPDC004539 TaxID=3154280 RepID=UPI0033B66604